MMSSAEDWVANYLAMDGRACADCRYAHREREPHGERNIRCGAIDPERFERAQPEDCPAWLAANSQTLS